MASPEERFIGVLLIIVGALVVIAVAVSWKAALFAAAGLAIGVGIVMVTF